MTWTVQTTDLRRRSRDILDRVRLKREAAIIQSYNTPQAVLIPYEEFQNYAKWRIANAKRVAWLSELRRIAEDVSARAALSESEASDLVNEAIRETRET